LTCFKAVADVLDRTFDEGRHINHQECENFCTTNILVKRNDLCMALGDDRARPNHGAIMKVSVRVRVRMTAGSEQGIFTIVT
jgi:hypothetical protein